jgi:hypothetical protein
MICALEEWRHLIQGGRHTTTIYSDHKNLTYWKEPQKLNRRQARWTQTLSEYDIELIHKPGNQMLIADLLSRRANHIPKEDNDNEDITVLPQKLFVNLVDINLQNKIAKSRSYDADATSAIEILKKQGPTTLQKNLQEWTTEEHEGNTILFFKGKAYIPKDEELRREIVRRYHDSRTAGHPGELETFNAIRQHYYWPQMRHYIKKYVEGCMLCQEFKIDRHPANPSLQPIPGSKSPQPFANCSMDMITDLPLIKGKDSILSVVDHGHTKGIILIPCNKLINSNGISQLLLDKVYARFGCLDSIISDRGPQFASKSFRELLKKALGTDTFLTTAYHPQGDGTTERFNQEIEAYLSIYCSNNPESWLDSIGLPEFTHNNRRHADRIHTAFELMYGITPRSFPLPYEYTKYPAVEDQFKKLEQDRAEALAAHEFSRSKMAE